LDPEESLFPLEFHLAGTPISLQGRPASRERWKAEVKEAARQRIAETTEWSWLDPEPLALALTIYYFPSTPMGGDIDNIVKPIMDALVGVAYLDDKWIERVTVQKFEPGLGWTFSAPSEQLSAALSAASRLETEIPVVYVHVGNDLSWRRL
jgi:crossover junction endodeoxyribonuclease RusA